MNWHGQKVDGTGEGEVLGWQRDIQITTRGWLQVVLVGVETFQLLQIELIVGAHIQPHQLVLHCVSFDYTEPNGVHWRRASLLCSWLCPKWHLNPYIVHYVWSEPCGPCTKVVYNIGSRVPLGHCTAPHSSIQETAGVWWILNQQLCAENIRKKQHFTTESHIWFDSDEDIIHDWMGRME